MTDHQIDLRHEPSAEPQALDYRVITKTLVEAITAMRPSAMQLGEFNQIFQRVIETTEDQTALALAEIKEKINRDFDRRRRET